MKNKVIHIISQAHIDPVWIWPLRDGISTILTSLQSAVDRLFEFPQMKYTCSSAYVYRQIEKVAPELFAKIQTLVAENRWEIIGNWEVQADCNLPSEESFFRQNLYAREYLIEKFGEGALTEISYCVDSFGHAGMLPQILKKCNFKAHVFMRPMVGNNPNIPLLFNWQSADKSKILGIRIPIQYSQSYAATGDDIEQCIRVGATECFAKDFNCGAFWFGVGNYGGGPTIEHVKKIISLQNDPDLPEIRFSTVREFLADVENSSAYSSLPTIEGELGYVFRGCYSSTAEIKHDNSHCENALKATETMALLANRYQQEKDDIQKAWSKTSFNQFHDILAGSCINSAQQENKNRSASALDYTHNSMLDSIFSIVRNVDTKGEKSVLCVANTLPWKRKIAIAFDGFRQPHEIEEITHLENFASTKKFPIQWMKGDANFGPWRMEWARLFALVEVDALGYEVFRVAAKELKVEDIKTKDFKAFENADPVNKFIEGETNGLPKCSISKESAISSLKDARNIEFLSGAISTVVIADDQGTWGHEAQKFDKIIGTTEVFETEILEEGDLIKIVRQKSKWNSSTVIMDVVYYKDIDGVELRFKIDWKERRTILKLVVPTTIISDKNFARMPAEVIMRANDGCEYPCHRWIALEDKEKALIMVNDGMYSYDVENSTMRMVLAKSVPMAEARAFMYKDIRNLDFLDQNIIEHKLFLLPANDISMADKFSQEFNSPVIFAQDGGHSGVLPWQKSLFKIDANNINILSIKGEDFIENRNSIIVRLQEINGKNCLVNLSSDLQVNFNPWEIKTIKICDNKLSIVHALTES